jgi:NADH:ubiquinone oxidoreductase subunit 6 (subunit J)
MLASLLAADPPESGLVAAFNQWAWALPLVVGALTVYWLLPRPRAYPVLWGVAAGAVALVLGGVLLVRLGKAWQENLLFYLFAGITLVAGATLVTQRNPARAALSFALVILATCGLFLLLAAPFLMAATIIVYAGAIVVTFLFVIMLAQQEGLSDADARSREPLLATLTGFVLLGALLYVIRTGSDPARTRELDEALASIREARQGEKPAPDAEPDKVVRNAMEKLGFVDLREMTRDAMGSSPEDLDHLERIVGLARERLTLAPPPARETPDAAGQVRDVPLSGLSGPPANTPRADVRRNPHGVPELPDQNAAYLGKSLFSDFLLPVELGGLLLLVATVGAIAIAQRREPGARAPIPGPRDHAATGVEVEGRTL